MSEKYEAANLILKLYDLRREEVMRKARGWFIAEFNPASVQDISNVTMGEHSAFYRMVTTYWDMACSFVGWSGHTGNYRPQGAFPAGQSAWRVDDT